MTTPTVIVGTRGSLLAVAQAEFLVKHLESKGFRVDWKRYTTSGDQWLNGPLDESRGSGFFTKELEDALADETVDLLIHSLKDVSLERPQGVQIACIPSREDCSDWLVMRKDAPKHCIIGTSSVRRERMLKSTFLKAPQARGCQHGAVQRFAPHFTITHTLHARGHIATDPSELRIGEGRF